MRGKSLSLFAHFRGVSCIFSQFSSLFCPSHSRFQNYTRQRTEDVVEWTDTDYHNTLCSSCNQVCHERCGLEEIKSAGDCRFTLCYAFRGNSHCQECCSEAGRCDHSTHYHARKKPTKSTKTVEDVLLDIKQKYDDAVEGLQRSQADLTKLHDTKKLIEDSIDQNTKDVEDSCETIKSICKGDTYKRRYRASRNSTSQRVIKFNKPIRFHTDRNEYVLSLSVEITTVRELCM